MDDPRTAQRRIQIRPRPVTPLWECRRAERRPSVLIHRLSPTESEIEFFFEMVPLESSAGPLQAASRRRNADAQSPKGRCTLDSKSGTHQSPTGLDRHGKRALVSYIRTLHQGRKEGKFAGGKDISAHGASRSWEFGYLDEIRKFADEVPWLKYVPTVSRPLDDQK